MKEYGIVTSIYLFKFSLLTKKDIFIVKRISIMLNIYNPKNSIILIIEGPYQRKKKQKKIFFKFDYYKNNKNNQSSL